MDKYEREITRATWDLIEASYEMGEDAWQFGEYMEDSAREIAVHFDLPYLSVKEDLDYAYLRQIRSIRDITKKFLMTRSQVSERRSKKGKIL